MNFPLSLQISRRFSPQRLGVHRPVQYRIYGGKSSNRANLSPSRFLFSCYLCSNNIYSPSRLVKWANLGAAIARDSDTLSCQEKSLKLGRGSYVKTTVFMSVLLGWRHVSATVGYPQVEHIIGSIRINSMTKRSRLKFRICTTTNDLILYSFSSL